MSVFLSLLPHALKENQLALETSQIELLANYLSLMQKWNRVYNLTTITSPKEMVYLHLIDSLIIQPYLQGTRILDVGTGAGLPGIPLAITHPTYHFTLLDKNNKKTRFLTQVVAELDLKNVTVELKRCEDFHPALRFDSILSRAVGSLTTLLSTTQHLLGANGKLLVMKGKYPHDEISDIPVAWQTEVNPLTMKGCEVERHLVCLVKKEE